MIRPITIIACLTLSSAAFAQTTDHSGHSMAATDGSPSTQAFIAANDKMHTDMAIEYTGNADVDFIRGMIAHHQGAVDAARVVLEHGADPEVRAFAEGVIAAQEAEIAWMTTWLAANAP
ncbi:MAG: CopM family metallochaperone [Paracoccaceae bacterium]